MANLPAKTPLRCPRSQEAVHPTSTGYVPSSPASAAATARQARIMQLANLHIHRHYSEDHMACYIRAFTSLKDTFESNMVKFQHFQRFIRPPGEVHSGLHNYTIPEWERLYEKLKGRAPALMNLLAKPRPYEITLKQLLDLVSFLNSMEVLLLQLNALGFKSVDVSMNQPSTAAIEASGSLRPTVETIASDITLDAFVGPAVFRAPVRTSSRLDHDTSLTPKPHSDSTRSKPMSSEQLNNSQMSLNIEPSSRTEIVLLAQVPAAPAVQHAPTATFHSMTIGNESGRGCAETMPTIVISSSNIEGLPRPSPAQPLEGEPPHTEYAVDQFRTFIGPESVQPNSDLLATLLFNANTRPKPTARDCLLYWLLQGDPEDDNIAQLSKSEEGKSLFRLLMCLWAQPVVGTGPFDREWKRLLREREIKRRTDTAAESEVSVVSVLVMMSLFGAEFGFGLMRGRKPLGPQRPAITEGVCENHNATPVQEDTPVKATARSLDLLASSKGPKSNAANVALTLPQRTVRSPKTEAICPVCKKNFEILRGCPCAVSLLRGMGVLAPSIPGTVLTRPNTRNGQRRPSGPQSPAPGAEWRSERPIFETTTETPKFSRTWEVPVSGTSDGTDPPSRSPKDTPKADPGSSSDTTEYFSVGASSSDTYNLLGGVSSRINKWIVDEQGKIIKVNSQTTSPGTQPTNFVDSPLGYADRPEIPQSQYESPALAIGSGSSRESKAELLNKPLLDLRTPSAVSEIQYTPGTQSPYDQSPASFSGVSDPFQSIESSSALSEELPDVPDVACTDAPLADRKVNIDNTKPKLTVPAGSIKACAFPLIKFPSNVVAPVSVGRRERLYIAPGSFDTPSLYTPSEAGSDICDSAAARSDENVKCIESHASPGPAQGTVNFNERKLAAEEGKLSPAVRSDDCDAGGEEGYATADVFMVEPQHGGDFRGHFSDQSDGAASEDGSATPTEFTYLRNTHVASRSAFASDAEDTDSDVNIGRTQFVWAPYLHHPPKHFINCASMFTDSNRLPEIDSPPPFQAHIPTIRHLRPRYRSGRASMHRPAVYSLWEYMGGQKREGKGKERERAMEVRHEDEVEDEGRRYVWTPPPFMGVAGDGVEEALSHAWTPPPFLSIDGCAGCAEAAGEIRTEEQKEDVASDGRAGETESAVRAAAAEPEPAAPRTEMSPWCSHHRQAAGTLEDSLQDGEGEGETEWQGRMPEDMVLGPMMRAGLWM